MTIRRVVCPEVPESAAPFSQCLVVDRQVFLSGVTAAGPNGEVRGGSDMAAQTRACLEKISHLLRAAGSGLQDVVKLTIYTTDISRRVEISAARREVLEAPFPCSTLVEVKALAAPGLMVEIDATALIGASQGD
jgi:enamine deaminase RidA (YjgF/YER057c/UK114 family)